MPWVRGAASARPMPAGVIMLATPPAALPGPARNPVWLPRLRADEAASQIFLPWQGAAFGPLPGLSISIPNPLTVFTQLGPFALVHIKRTDGGDAELRPLGVREPQPVRALVRSVDPPLPQRFPRAIAALKN